MFCMGLNSHCIWINGCVGFSNYKTFVLFLSYTTIFIIWLLYNYLHFIVKNIQMNTSFVGLLWILYKTYISCIITILSNLCNSIWTRSFTSPFIGLPSLNLNIPTHNFVMVFFGIIFGLLLLGLSTYHYYLILKNRTTIEQVATKDQYFRIKAGNEVHHDHYQHQDIRVVKKSPPEKDTFYIGRFNNWKSVMGQKWYLFGIPWENKQDNGGYIFPYNSVIYQKLIKLSTNQQ
ncbi:unnamed protein product [Cunninghamella echinulata]